MNCQELIDKLIDFLNGELEGAHRIAVASHLGECGHCTLLVESYTLTIQFVGKLPKSRPLPEGVEARLRAVLKEHLCDSPTDDAKA